MVRVFQSHAVALDGFHNLVDGCVLGNHFFLEYLAHISQTDILALCHLLDRDACHVAYYLGDFRFVEGDTVVRIAMFPLLAHHLNVAFLLCLVVSQCCSHLEVLASHGSLFFGDGCIEFLFSLYEFVRDGRTVNVNVSASLVHHINGLIWEGTVVHVSVCKLYACFQCFVCVAHIMMLFVFLLDVMQNL